eukprot:CAMPEP_0172299642 /NCGR_PEP_ID=MMETSP1058-20130122/1901_1 /TAXON_ID=83371 /ORGANISM="Detonula confervacea, Strain CCMP 353" /LENGTH=73 /DNA_ID=CAMNT_0013009159 /DNA_START=908 /DNA_END=1129 /DNA_ORIENTATION=+
MAEPVSSDNYPFPSSAPSKNKSNQKTKQMRLSPDATSDQPLSWLGGSISEFLSLEMGPAKELCDGCAVGSGVE